MKLVLWLCYRRQVKCEKCGEDQPLIPRLHTRVLLGGLTVADRLARRLLGGIRS